MSSGRVQSADVNRWSLENLGIFIGSVSGTNSVFDLGETAIHRIVRIIGIVDDDDPDRLHAARSIFECALRLDRSSGEYDVFGRREESLLCSNRSCR